jgi:hypothetical protein
MSIHVRSPISRSDDYRSWRKVAFDVKFHGSPKRLPIACFDQEEGENHDQVLKVRSPIRAKFHSFRSQQLFMNYILKTPTADIPCHRLVLARDSPLSPGVLWPTWIETWHHVLGRKSEWKCQLSDSDALKFRNCHTSWTSYCVIINEISGGLCGKACFICDWEMRPDH